MKNKFKVAYEKTKAWTNVTVTLNTGETKSIYNTHQTNPNKTKTNV